MEIVSSGTKQVVLYRKMTSERGAEMRLFCNAHVLSDLRKRLKTRVFAAEGRLARKDAILTSRFVAIFPYKIKRPSLCDCREDLS